MLDENGNVQEPNWSIHMFWEDITAVIQFLWGLIKSLFGLSE